jgi:hypothetical protein
VSSTEEPNHDPENNGDLTRAVVSRIGAHIERSGRSVAEVATDAGMTLGQLEATLTGRRGLFVTEAILLAMALGIEVGTLFADQVADDDLSHA